MDNIDDLPVSAENTAQKQQRGRPFEAGKSGNPRGRPKGSRNKATLAMEALLDGEANAILAKIVEKAKEGDPIALRLCLERLLPARRDRPVSFDMPDIKSAADASAASSAVLTACADGTLSLDEGNKVMAMIANHIRTLDAAEFEARLSAVERGQKP